MTADAPQADAPQAGAPQAGAPQAGAPKADAPQAGAPKADAPPGPGPGVLCRLSAAYRRSLDAAAAARNSGKAEKRAGPCTSSGLHQ
ncbi:hypothetical protein EYF80_028703 [Liparis tanakae]|uniref:Uncharacterized protein n=1 Tax=Liparis tanakae TaxID=230148 RepID=A0A4Z2H6A1_9TELE|nr:hypothetical protein EYF80_028703 [Liparis tanakae]